jgi:integrase
MVIHKRAKKYFHTGKSITEKEWERLPMTKAIDLQEKREEIRISFEIIKKHVVDLLAEDKFSLANLDISLKRRSGKTLNELIEAKISQCKAAKRVGTMLSFKTTLANVCKYKSGGILIDDVTQEWLCGLEGFMIGAGRSITTVAINMRNIRTMMNVAKKARLIGDQQYPFGEGKFVIKTEAGKKKALDMKQIAKIQNFRSDDRNMEMYRDLWLFIYFCNGINIADLIHLKFKDIIDGEIDYIRAKTKNTTKTVRHVRAVITDEMQTIIDRWGNEPRPDNHIFNLIEHTDDAELEMSRKSWFTKKFNQHTKLIGAAVGVPNVTSYTARHSYATVLKRRGANIAYISESLGHTSLTTTQVYLDSFDKEERIKNAKLLKITEN